MVTIIGLRKSIGVPRIRLAHNRIAARLRDGPVALTIALVVAALVAALLEQLITMATGDWSWFALAKCLVRNASFALMLAGAVVLARTQRARHDTTNAMNQPATCAPVTIDELARELSNITDVAGELGMLPEAGRHDECSDAFEYLDAVRWSLANYLLRGDRTRRLMNTSDPLVELASCDDDLSRAARALRARADELAGQVQHTNAVVADWLVAHRVAVANPCYLDSNALFDRCQRGVLDPTSIAEDPLYLLICHLHDVLESEEYTVEAPALEHLQAQLTLPLCAVRRELAAAMAYSAAAIGVTRAVAKSGSA